MTAPLVFTQADQRGNIVTLDVVQYSIDSAVHCFYEAIEQHSDRPRFDVDRDKEFGTWGEPVRDRFGATLSRSAGLVFHCLTVLNQLVWLS
jgi:hypothetical protein